MFQVKTLDKTGWVIQVWLYLVFESIKRQISNPVLILCLAANHNDVSQFFNLSLLFRFLDLLFLHQLFQSLFLIMELVTLL